MAQSINSEEKNADIILEKRRFEMDNELFMQRHRFLFRLAVFVGFLLLMLLYVVEPVSKIKAITVHGNRYLKKSYIESLLNIEIGNLYLINIPFLMEQKLQSNALIASAQVTMDEEGVIAIEIEENVPVGYRYDEEEPTLLLADDTEINLTSDLMHLLDQVPFIVGFDDTQQTHLLVSNLVKLDTDVLNYISEIHQYSLIYDEETVELLMNDGRYVFSSYYELEKLNHYFSIRTSIANEDSCLFTVTDQSVIVSKACPWNETEVELDYWKDGDGNYVYNQWGDKAVKHYYTDSDGNQYLDDDGNPILIPIDFLSGEEEEDSNFKENYDNGYYKTGELIIDETEEDSNEEDTAQEETDNE